MKFVRPEKRFAHSVAVKLLVVPVPVPGVSVPGVLPVPPFPIVGRVTVAVPMP